MKSWQLHIIVLGLTGLLVFGCQKGDNIYTPLFDIKVDQTSGLTTDIFSLSISPQSTSPSDEKLHCRWDWEGDSLFSTKFSNDLQTDHRFLKPGNYKVTCEVLSLSGGKARDTVSITVEQGYSAPKAKFVVLPETGHFRTNFLFDASGTIDDEDSLETLKFRWDFENDGFWDTPYLDEPKVYHQFEIMEDFTVSLTVLDPSNKLGSISKVVELHRTDTCIVADFVWTCETGRVGDPFIFNASSSYHQTNPDVELIYKWQFPDREYTEGSTESYVEYEFQYPGPKRIVLLIEDGNGLQNTVEKELFVSVENTPPRPKIITPSKYGNVETLFYLNAWGSLDDYTPTSQLLLRWDFDGDGNWDTGKNSNMEIHYQYVEEGRYTCIMEAEDEEGLIATTSTELWVSPYDNPTSYLYDKRDGKYYGSVKIGNTWWMTDNLDYRDDEKMNIPMLQKCYDEDVGMCDQFGSLYQAKRCTGYLEAGNRICPDGWRLPNVDDLTELASNIPASNARTSLMVGGSAGFNAIYTGLGSYSFVYDLMTGTMIIDTLYFFDKYMEEVRYMSGTTRNSLPQRSHYLFGVQRNYDGFNQMWGDIEGYYPIRCVKED